MITEGAFASATSTATAFAVPKQNGCYQPFLSRSTTSTKPMIVEPVKNQARASRPVRCMSDTQTHPRPTNSHDLLTSQLSHFFGFVVIITCVVLISARILRQVQIFRPSWNSLEPF